MNSHKEDEDKKMKEYEKDKELFLSYKNDLVHLFGDKALSTSDCESIGKKYFGSEWGGCDAWNEVNPEPNKYYIVNTSSSQYSGIHWVGLYISDRIAYIWDSYNRPIKKIVPGLIKLLKKSGFKIGNTEHPMTQIGTTSQTCGHQSLAWILTTKDVGIRRSAII